VTAGQDLAEKVDEQRSRIGRCDMEIRPGLLRLYPFRLQEIHQTANRFGE
jgi:hypothetical protein